MEFITLTSIALVAGFEHIPAPAVRVRGMKDELVSREEWRTRSWAIALLVLMAVAFGVQLIMVGLAILTVATGVMVAGWTALLIMAIRKRNACSPHTVQKVDGI